MALTSMKGAMRKVKDLQYTEIEIKVRNATNSDPWGVQRSLMAEIAAATNSYEDYPKLFTMLWKRLLDENHVMHVQKALSLVEYLLCNGADRFIRDAKQRAMDIYRLQRYSHKNADAEDDAGDARALAVKVYALLTDEEKLKEERAKADRMRKLELGTGISNDTYGTHPVEAHHTQHSAEQGQQPPHNYTQPHNSSQPTPTKNQHHPQHSQNQPKALATHGLRSDIASRYESAAPSAAPVDEDDPFGAPPTLGAASTATTHARKPSASQKKTPKRKPASTKSTSATASFNASDLDDPFGAPPTLSVSASAQYAAHARKNSKQAVLAAFGEVQAASAPVAAKKPTQPAHDPLSGQMASLAVSEPIIDLFAPEPATESSEADKVQDIWAAASADAFDISKEKKSPSKPVTAPGKKTLAERAAADPMSLFDQPSKSPVQSNPFGGPGPVYSQQNPFGAPMGMPQQVVPAFAQPMVPQPARPDPFAPAGSAPAAAQLDPFSGLF